MNFLFHKPRPRQTAVPEPVEVKVPELAGAEIAAAFYGQRTGGDFHDFIRVSPDRVVFGLLDVAGGIKEARPILVAAQETFRTLAPQLFADENVNEAEAMTQLCLELNRTILDTEGGVRSCPAFAGCYSETLGTVCYFNAGHTAGLLRDNAGISELPATGLPLGLFSRATSDAPMVALEPGAALLLVSRGVLEGKCKGNEFGMESVKSRLQRSANETAKQLSAAVIGDIEQFMCKPPTHNDVTSLALVRAR